MKVHVPKAQREETIRFTLKDGRSAQDTVPRNGSRL